MTSTELVEQLNNALMDATRYGFMPIEIVGLCDAAKAIRDDYLPAIRRGLKAESALHDAIKTIEILEGVKRAGLFIRRRTRRHIGRDSYSPVLATDHRWRQARVEGVRERVLQGVGNG